MPAIENRLTSNAARGSPGPRTAVLPIAATVVSIVATTTVVYFTPTRILLYVAGTVVASVFATRVLIALIREYGGSSDTRRRRGDCSPPPPPATHSEIRDAAFQSRLSELRETLDLKNDAEREVNEVLRVLHMFAPMPVSELIDLCPVARKRVEEILTELRTSGLISSAFDGEQDQVRLEAPRRDPTPAPPQTVGTR